MIKIMSQVVVTSADNLPEYVSVNSITWWHCPLIVTLQAREIGCVFLYLPFIPFPLQNF
jgi:hypothetical protein